jgi:hypothetical protein
MQCNKAKQSQCPRGRLLVSESLEHQLMNPSRNAVVLASRFDADLDAVERFLAERSKARN